MTLYAAADYNLEESKDCEAAARTITVVKKTVRLWVLVEMMEEGKYECEKEFRVLLNKVC